MRISALKLYIVLILIRLLSYRKRLKTSEMAGHQRKRSAWRRPVLQDVEWMGRFDPSGIKDTAAGLMPSSVAGPASRPAQIITNLLGRSRNRQQRAASYERFGVSHRSTCSID